MLAFFVGSFVTVSLVGFGLLFKKWEKEREANHLRKQIDKFERFGSGGKVTATNYCNVWLSNDDGIQIGIEKRNIFGDELLVKEGETWELKLLDDGQIRLLKRIS